MTRRELERVHDGGRALWAVELLGTVVAEEYGGLRITYHDSEEQAEAVFDRLLRDKLAEGYIETEASLSRRVFHHLAAPPGKFWIIHLDGSSHTVQFGKIPAQPPQGTAHLGQRRTKNFETPEKALASYYMLIARKLNEGYVELPPRPMPLRATPDSRPGDAGQSENAGIERQG